MAHVHPQLMDEIKLSLQNILSLGQCRCQFYKIEIMFKAREYPIRYTYFDI